MYKKINWAEKSVKEIWETLTEKQKDCIYCMIGIALLDKLDWGKAMKLLSLEQKKVIKTLNISQRNTCKFLHNEALQMKGF